VNRNILAVRMTDTERASAERLATVEKVATEHTGSTTAIDTSCESRAVATGRQCTEDQSKSMSVTLTKLCLNTETLEARWRSRQRTTNG